MAIKAIVFDCFGVLVTSARVALKNDYPQFVKEIDDLDHQADYGMISRQQFNEELSKLINLTANEIESKYWGSSVKIERSLKWLWKLKKTGKYKIGMLSNVGKGFFESYFTMAERKELFDAAVLSSDVGVAKPDIIAYEIIAERLGVKATDIADVEVVAEDMNDD